MESHCSFLSSQNSTKHCNTKNAKHASKTSIDDFNRRWLHQVDSCGRSLNISANHWLPTRIYVGPLNTTHFFSISFVLLCLPVESRELETYVFSIYSNVKLIHLLLVPTLVIVFCLLFCKFEQYVFVHD